jgi:hypothetical protein
MNNQEKNMEDQLRKYINPERIEKAPEGFTSKVMTHIQFETIPIKQAGMLHNISLVPVISASVTILLIVAAFLIPGNKTDSLAIPMAKLIKNIRFTLPEVNFTSLFSFNLPSMLIYLFFGILTLTLFDRALNGIFHRVK